MAIRELSEKTSNQLYGRIYQHLKDSITFAIVGSQDSTTYESRYEELIDLVRKYSYKNKIHGFNYVDGTYTYEDNADQIAFEQSVILYDIKKEDALEMGRKLNQQSIIFKDSNFFGELYCSDGRVKTVFPKRTLNFSKNNYPSKDDLSSGLFGTKSPKDKLNKYGFRFEANIRTGGVTSNGQYYGRKVPVIFAESYDEDAVDTTGWSAQTPVPLKSLKKGDLFTLKDIPSPKDSQVYIKGDYDKSTRTFECTKYSDMNSWRNFKGDKMVYIDFYF